MCVCNSTKNSFKTQQRGKCLGDTSFGPALLTMRNSGSSDTSNQNPALRGTDASHCGFLFKKKIFFFYYIFLSKTFHSLRTKSRKIENGGHRRMETQLQNEHHLKYHTGWKAHRAIEPFAINLAIPKGHSHMQA